MDDCYFYNGFTNSFYFRHMPPLIKNVRLNLSALRSRVTCLLHTFPDNNHKCWVDNMCAFVNFTSQSLKHKAREILEGACRKDGRGFPEMLKQEEVK